MIEMSNVDINLTWQLVSETIRKIENDSRDDLEAATKEKEDAETNLQLYIQHLTETGFLDSLEKEQYLQCILAQKISEADAKFEFYSKGAQKIFNESFASFQNVLTAKVDKHNNDLNSLLN